MRRRFRSLIPFLNFLPVLVILGAFAWITFETANPLQRVEKEPLAVGRVVPDEELLRLQPQQTYVALYAGSGRELPQFAVDEALADDEDGTFALRADRADGDRFFLFVRVETSDFSLFCVTRPLPPVRPNEDGTWALASNGAVVPQLTIEVRPTDRCHR